MRCPNCGGLNLDQAQFCVRCGRTLLPSAAPAQTTSSQRPPYQQPPRQMPPTQGTTAPQPYQPPRPPVQPARPIPQNAPSGARSGRSSAPPAPITPNIPQGPEPPGPFPPRTIAQLQALESGALPYTIAQDSVAAGRKKIVRIVYQRSSAWQQVATLLKAFKEQRSDTFNTIIIQGVFEQDINVYAFTNGQLVFDQNVRLGSQTMNRYQIETGTGFEFDSLRIVLSE